MFACIWDICVSVSMLIAGFAGAALSWADAIGIDDRVMVVIAVNRNEVFMFAIP
jgi:hypothetical protein